MPTCLAPSFPSLSKCLRWRGKKETRRKTFEKMWKVLVPPAAAPLAACTHACPVSRPLAACPLPSGTVAFASAVDWSERWIQAVVAFHVLLWLSTILTRKRFGPQAFFFFLISACVGASETLNTYAHLNWRAFSNQDYFDAHGFFISVMFAGPLLLLALFQMVNFLHTAAHLLVDVKREELKRSRQTDGKLSDGKQKSS